MTIPDKPHSSKQKYRLTDEGRNRLAQRGGGIMDVKTATIQVMQQAETALHAKDIAEQIMAAGLWQSEGKTPDATVSARLYAAVELA